MLSTNTVFDLLPVVVVLYDKLDIDGYRKKISEQNKNKKNINNNVLGIELFKYILSNSGKIKEEVFEIVAIVEEKTIDEIKAQSFMTTINTIKDILTDKEATDFLAQAIK